MTCAIKNNRQQCDRAAMRTLIKTVASTATPEQLTALSVSSISHTLNADTATVTTGASHYLEAGDEVTISGANEAGFNGTFRVLTTPTATTYTINVPANQAVSATGTITQVGHILYRSATLYGKRAARTDNTSDAYFGPESADGAQPHLLQAGGEVSVDVATGVALDLADLYLDVGTNADGVVVSFH